MKDLELSLVTGYQYQIAIDETKIKTVGYYRDHTVALTDAENDNSGWFGTKAREVTGVNLYSDGINLYEVKPVGKFIDEERTYNETVLNRIKQKLTKGELDFLGIEYEKESKN